jgi:hypothetical protein
MGPIASPAHLSVTVYVPGLAITSDEMGKTIRYGRNLRSSNC